MSIDRSPSIGVVDVQGIAITIRRDFDSRNIAICYTQQGYALFSLGLDIYAGMEVIPPHLSEITREDQRNIHRRDVARLGLSQDVLAEYA